MLGKKSQAALEFLMTYGWAILVVLVAVGALAYFGVLSPDALFPNKCTLADGIVCLDHNVESYRVIIVLKNARGEPITINKIVVSGNSQECLDNQSIALNNNEKVVFTITECSNGLSGARFDGMINVTYVPEDKLSHIASGTLRTKVVEGSSITSQSICQNAETNSLCDGLDIVYGIGYKAACCSEHSLCC